MTSRHAANQAHNVSRVLVARTTKRTGTDNGDANAPAQTLSAALRDAKYRNPRQIEDGGYVVPVAPAGNQRLRVTFQRAPVVAFPGRTGAGSRPALLLVTREQYKQAMEADRSVVDTIKAHSAAWFDEPIDSRVIDECYRPLAVSHPVHGSCVRAYLVSTSNAVHPGESDVELQLVGIQFRKQYVALVWKAVATTPSRNEKKDPSAKTEEGRAGGAAGAGNEGRDDYEEDPALDGGTGVAAEDDRPAPSSSAAAAAAADEAEPKRDSHAAAAGTGDRASSRRASRTVHPKEYSFLSDDDDDDPNGSLENRADDTDGDEAEEDDDPVPTWEDYDVLRHRVMTHLDQKRNELQRWVRALETHARELRKTQVQNMDAIQRAVDCVDSVPSASSTTK